MIKQMKLEKAKELVRNLASGDVKDQLKPEISEAIRMVCEQSLANSECKEIQNYIPSHMQYMGLYPFVVRQIKI